MKKTIQNRKFPSLNRRPSGLKPAIQAAIAKAAEGVTADGVRAVIEGDDDEVDDDDRRAAEEWLFAHEGLDPMHVWWVLSNAQMEAAQSAALGLDQDSAGDPLVEAIKMLRERYVYAAFRHQFWDRNVRDWIDPKALDEYQAVNMPIGDDGEPMSPVKIFRRDRYADRVHNERFIPGDSSEIVSKDGGEWLNSWKASEIEQRGAMRHGCWTTFSTSATATRRSRVNSSTGWRSPRRALA